MTEFKAGDTIWRFDQNRRIYPKDAAGKVVHGPPIYEKHFEEYKVLAVESRALVVARSNDQHLSNLQVRLNKKTLREPGDHGCTYYSDAAKAAKIWDKIHRNQIVDRISSSSRTSVETLKEIAKLIGYEG